MTLDEHPTATLDRDEALELYAVLTESTLAYSKLTRNALLVYLREQDDPIEVSFGQGTSQVKYAIRAAEQRIDRYRQQGASNHVAAGRLRRAIDELETLT